MNGDAGKKEMGRDKKKKRTDCKNITKRKKVADWNGNEIEEEKRYLSEKKRRKKTLEISPKNC